MKFLYTLLSTAAVVASSSINAAIVLNTFDSGTAAENGYYRFGTTGTTLSTDNVSGTLALSYTADAANRSGVIKQFTATSIEVGETLIFSFTLANRSLRGDENNSFRFSIGNIGTSITSDIASAEPFSGGTRRNYVFAAATGVASTAFNQHSAGFSSPVNGGTNTAISGLTASNFSNSSSQSFAVSVSFTRTLTGLDIQKDFGGSISSGSFTTATAADFSFNTIAFSMNNAGDYNFALSDVSVTVIPEPSTMAALLGIASFACVMLRRYQIAKAAL